MPRATTNSRRTLSMLREAERTLRKIVEHSTNLFYMHTADHTLTYVSPQSRQYFDCEPEEAMVRWTEFITDHPVNRAAVESTQRAIDTGEQQPAYEIECISRTGRKIWVEVNETPIVENGKTVAVVGSLTDITERKKAEEALRESEQRYRNLFHHNHAVMLLIDRHDGRIIDANSAACSYYGYSLEEITDLSISDFNTLPADQLRVMMQQTASTRRQHFFFQHRLADGQIRDVEVFSGPQLINGREFLYSIIHDITDRKRIENALRESEQRFASFMLHLPAAAWLKDMKGRYIFANVEAERIFALPLSDLQGKLDEELLPPETARQFRESDERALAEGGRFQTTHVIRKTDGSEHHFITSKFVVPDSDGHPAYIAGVAFDITDRYRAEEEIVRLNADLEARAKELEFVNRELEAFNYTVAHDLRKPLTVINGYSQILQEICSDKFDQQCIDYLDIIYDHTLNMSQLIDSLLSFSSLAHAELHLETIDLSALAQEVVAELKLIEPERRIMFRVAEGITVKGDTSLLRVVMNNLIGNAWKYTDNQEEASIELGISEIDGKTAFFIRDNGIGFDLKDAELLFLPFRRLPSARKIKGFGIGLATAERIIRRHGGKIWAEGKPGEGATFYFTLR